MRPVRHARSDYTQKSLPMLQSRCKTFISRGDVPCSVRKDETVSEGNWRSPLSAAKMLLVMRSQEMPPSSSVSLPHFLSPPYSLYPYFLFVLLSCTHHTFLPLILAVWGHLRCRPARYCRNVRIRTYKLVCICSV